MPIFNRPFALANAGEEAPKDISSASRMGALRSRSEIGVNAKLISSTSRMGALRSQATITEVVPIPISSASRMGALRSQATLVQSTTNPVSSASRMGALRSSSPFVGVNTIQFTRVSDGDENDILYWLGTNKGAGAWANPALGSLLTMSASSVLSDAPTSNGPDLLTDRIVNGNSNVAHTKNTDINPWFVFDMSTSGYKFVLTDIAYRGRLSAAHLPRNWAFQGSNDGVTWVNLTINENETAINGDVWYTEQAIDHPPYNQFRMLQTGLNASSDTFLVVGEIQLYGLGYPD